MTGFLAITGWDGSPLPEGTAAENLHPLHGGSVDSRAALSVPGADVATSVRPVQEGDTAARSIHVDAERCWLAIGDVTLYDETSLRRELGVGSDGSSLELVTRVYARAGDLGVSRIHGDFAVVIWDWRERTVHALRDHFGLRPLYYRSLRNGMALASDVRPLLALGSVAEERLDPDTILDYALGDLAHHGLTFFEAIRQVWPGNRLTAGPTGVQQARYWIPSLATRKTLRYPDMIAEWRHLFERAVARRLDSSHPVASYLSGGLDSGSIVGAAHDLYQREPTDRPPLFLLSALFPGLPACDESELIRDTARARPNFRSLTWDGTDINAGDLTTPHPVEPGLQCGIGFGPRHEVDEIERHDIRVVLSGFGGDDLGWCHGYFRDVVSCGKFATLLREMAQMSSWERAIAQVRSGLRGIAAPVSRDRAPGWVTPLTRSAFEARSDHRRPADFTFESFSQQETWWLATLPAASIITDSIRLALSEGGAQLRLPYRDLRLTEFVLEVPWELRAPHGDLRHVQRRAIEGFLAPAARRSRRKALAGQALLHQLRANLCEMTKILHSRSWTLGDYVDPEGVREMLGRLQHTDPRMGNPRAWWSLWKIAILEVWNRARLHYDVPRRTRMQDDNGSSGPERDATPRRVNTKPKYEAPVLVPVGNARDLLSLTQGPSFDMQAPADGQNG